MNFFLKRIAILFVFAASNLIAQQELADSLVNELSNLSGEDKVVVLNSLADIYQHINTYTAIDYASQGLELAKSIGYKKGEAGCYGSLGFCYINLNKQKAIEFTSEALRIRREIDDEAGIATSLNVLGVINYYSGNYIPSIEYHLQSIKIKEEIGNEVSLATSYNNVSLVHLALGDFESALDYLNKALKIREKTNNLRGVGIIKTNIGEIYKQIGKTELALKNLEEALEINEKIGNKKSQANSLFSLATFYRTSEDYQKAFNNFDLALELYYKLDEKNGIANVENGLAELHKINGDLIKAQKHAHRALEYATEIHALDNIAKASNILQECYYEQKNYNEAYNFLNMFQTASDSLKNTAKLKKLAKIELDFKLDRIRKEQDSEISRQKFFVQLLSVTSIFALIIIIVVFVSGRTKRKTNIRLNELNKKLQEVNASKDRFFSIIAHDLRGPYQNLLGLSGLLANEYEELSDKEVKTAANGLHDSLQKQYNLLNELLHWAELQAGRFELQQESISLNKCINNVVEPLLLAAHQKGVKILNIVAPEINVFADSNMLSLVVRNLVSNGIKFTNQNNEIVIDADVNNGFVSVNITDNGIGISENDLKKLFRIDVHLSNKGTRNESGTGLGLILCKEIIENHGGQINVTSKLDEGTQFIFTIPLQQLN